MGIMFLVFRDNFGKMVPFWGGPTAIGRYAYSYKRSPAMSTSIQAAISELQNQIQSLEHEIADTKRVCNTLAKRGGLPPVYSDADLQTKTTATSMRRDQFYGKTLTTAMREYMQMRLAANMGPVTVNEMFDALVQGGFDHGSANEDNAKRVMRITLTKNSSIFHRLPDDKHFGLAEWYPNVRAKKVDKSEDEDTGGDEKKPDEKHSKDASAKGSADAAKVKQGKA